MVSKPLSRPHIPGEAAFRLTAFVQTLARELGVDAERRLRALWPHAFGDNPREVSVATPGPEEPVEPYPSSRWSQFQDNKSDNS